MRTLSSYVLMMGLLLGGNVFAQVADNAGHADSQSLQPDADAELTRALDDLQQGKQVDDATLQSMTDEDRHRYLSALREQRNEERRQYFNSLSPEQQQDYLDNAPQVIGNPALLTRSPSSRITDPEMVAPFEMDNSNRAAQPIEYQGKVYPTMEAMTDGDREKYLTVLAVQKDEIRKKFLENQIHVLDPQTTASEKPSTDKEDFQQ